MMPMGQPRGMPFATLVGSGRTSVTTFVLVWMWWREPFLPTGCRLVARDNWDTGKQFCSSTKCSVKGFSCELLQTSI